MHAAYFDEDDAAMDEEAAAAGGCHAFDRGHHERVAMLRRHRLQIARISTTGQTLKRLAVASVMVLALLAAALAAKRCSQRGCLQARPPQIPVRRPAADLAPLGADALPPQWRPSGSQNCNVVQEFPHDISSFTQGLEAAPGSCGGWLEGTGRYGRSRMIRSTSEGQVLATHVLDPDVFGEGITTMDGFLYQLTWKQDTIFVYQLDGASMFGAPQVRKGVLQQFDRKEGWGICNDGSRIIASDGSNKLYVLEPGNLSVVDTHVVGGNDPDGMRISQINELEHANGQVYFNVWNKDYIGVYDLAQRKVASWIDCSGLVTRQKEDNRHADVLNGIAFTQPGNGIPRRMVVTGKLWNRMYQVDYELPPEPLWTN